MRLERLIAERSALSRSDARAAIRRGRVAVDGQRCRKPGARVGPDAVVELDGTPLVEAPLLAVLHKPVGVQCVVGDPHGRPDLRSVGAALLERGLHPVGRLDADTSGLLPWSREGGLTQRLLHPRHAVEKTYLATVAGDPPSDLARRLGQGVEMALGVHTATLQQVRGRTILLTVTEGKHRMVRRMLANLGLPVEALHRRRFGALELGDLATGAWRAATDAERAWAEDLQRGAPDTAS